MNETSKARARRATEGEYERLLQGKGIDIGCGTDPISQSWHIDEHCDTWDVEQGDAQYLDGVPDDHYDFVYSSHCLEHMRSPQEALLNWWRVLKPGGHLIVAIPDEDLYEQGNWPSAYNDDHKHTFTASKSRSWSPVSLNVSELIRMLPEHKLISLRTIDTNYDHARTDGADQTMGDAEAAIEFIVQKKPVQPDGVIVITCAACGAQGLLAKDGGA